MLQTRLILMTITLKKFEITPAMITSLESNKDISSSDVIVAAKKAKVVDSVE